MTWFRRDSRNEIFTVADGATVTVVDLQVSGLEPVMMSVSGGDVTMSYTRGGTGPVIQDGTVITWGANEGNPFNGNVFLSWNAGGTATVAFMITGGIQGDITRI